MWINKPGTPSPKKQPPARQIAAPVKELHVPHHVEMEISGLLIHSRRLEMRLGRQLMHFVSITRNADGTVDYVVRSRMHTHTGLERNFESLVRLNPSGSPELLR